MPAVMGTSATIEQCQYLDKHGNCKFFPVPGQRYCGNHLHEMTGLGRKRVPCPVDPTHMVCEEDLKAHLKKCPKVKQQRMAQAQPFYQQDINSCPPAALQAGAPNCPDDTSMDDNPFAGGRAAKRQATAEKLGPDGMRALIGKVTAAHATSGAADWEVATQVLAQFEQLLQPESCDAGSATTPFSEKHARQQAGILSIVQRAGMMEGAAGATWVEFGAGKGYLAGALAQCLPVQRLVLVDNGSFRFKAERALRRVKELQVVRVKCDVRHLRLLGVPEVAESGQWVGVGKHLCGACTDYTMHCCVNTASAAAATLTTSPSPSPLAQAAAPQPPPSSPNTATIHKQPRLADSLRSSSRPQHSSLRPEGNSNQSGTSAATASGSAQRWRGLAVATCCHHRCSWATYTGRALFERCGITPQEFELVSWMTGWAVCGHEDPRTQQKAAPVQGGPSSSKAVSETQPTTGSGSEPSPAAGPASASGTASVLDSTATVMAGTDTGTATNSSAATAGTSNGKEAAQQLQKGCGVGRGATAWLSREERIRVGAMCKQLIDMGRVEWARAQGCEVQMVEYAGMEVTGENRLLVVVPGADGVQTV